MGRATSTAEEVPGARLEVQLFSYSERRSSSEQYVELNLLVPGGAPPSPVGSFPTCRATALNARAWSRRCVYTCVPVNRRS